MLSMSHWYFINWLFIAICNIMCFDDRNYPSRYFNLWSNIRPNYRPNFTILIYLDLLKLKLERYNYTGCQLRKVLLAWGCSRQITSQEMICVNTMFSTTTISCKYIFKTCLLEKLFSVLDKSKFSLLMGTLCRVFTEV